jgi:glycosyltransferase involved in cell wall biosynthesis
MKTPVIIPAYNEEQNIHKLLRSLPSELVDPIVAVNGSTDNTADIAESFGAKVYSLPEQGKLPAITCSS